ncbi:MAG: Ig-like domain-containing protein, partial [Candidatus Thermoplasmatota archaeon]|nr:Ig-like domain-containing protein [Candidatus Thermoplasmatota archaeon]
VTDYTDIEINAQDNQSGMYSVTYRIWNTTHRWGPWMNYTNSFTLSNQGVHRVQYNATDNAGTRAFTQMTSSFNPLVYEEHRVDNIPPYVELLYPTGNEVESDIIDIQWIAADRIFDQGQLKQNNSLTITEDYPGHVQSFVPTKDSIDSVQLLISGDESIVSVKLFSEMFPVPTVIGQSVKHIGNIDIASWVDFPLGDSVTLDTSKTYYIGVTQTITGSTGFSWYYHDDATVDHYPYGHAWFKTTDELINESNIDFAFRTKYWLKDLDITIKYSITGDSPWSTIAENQPNTGSYQWNTETFGIPDGPNYKIRIEAIDTIGHIGFDSSDETFFIINQGGPGVYNINIVDTTIGDSSFTRNGHNLEISATITGDPETIIADLSGFGKGTAVEYTTFTGGVARWLVTNILCVPSDGPVTVTITAIDAVGDSGANSGTITADNTPPVISISKPRPGLYFMDSTRLLPFSYPFVIGQITFVADVSDAGSGVKSVEFYLENTLESTSTEPPYQWTWNRQATGFWDVEIVVTDIVGHETFDEIKDLFIINLGIFT